MSELRLRDTDRFLARERLLARLPDQPGFVVWLQAPYGYGKSVLAAQWALRLEAQHWRVLWCSAAHGGTRESLARLLALPAAADWELLGRALGERATAIVIEDLEDDAGLAPLFMQTSCLVLLASRRALPLAELPRLASAGRLLHLDAPALAFTRDEAQALFDDSVRAADAWRRTGGWPLLLHLAALTGEVTNEFGPGLLAGMRASLGAAAWDEALLLATLDRLPLAAAGDAALVLAAGGFAQRVDGAVRIHPLLADLLRAAHADAIRAVVRREAPRLPPLLRGAAFEATGLVAELAQLLDSETELARQDPQAVLRWDGIAPSASEPLRSVGQGSCRANQVGQALCLQGRIDEGVRWLQQAMDAAGDNLELRLLAAKELVWNLATLDRARALALVERIRPELEHASAELAGRFLSDASRIAFLDGDYATAEAMTREALARLAPDSPRRLAAQVNLGNLRFNRAGELDVRIHSARDALALAEAWVPEHVTGIHLDLGRLHALLGQREPMLVHLSQAAHGPRSRPWVNLHAEVLLEVARGAFDAAAAPLARLRAWADAEAIDGALGFWAWTLVGCGRAAEALALLQGADGFLARTSRALAQAAAGARVALDSLPRFDDAPEREASLYLAAARWRITRAPAELERLLGLTTAGARVLPGLVPLAELPRTQPQLALAYPLPQVLASDWKEAIVLRLDELPPLRLSLLGPVRAQRGAEVLDLAPRLQAIVALLALGHTREQIADALWPELSAPAARNNLHVNLNKLRRALEPWGVTTYLGEQGLLRADSDLAALQAALRAKDAAAALRLYRDDFARGVDLAAVEAARSHLRGDVIALLSSAARTATADDAEALLARVLELDPLDETALQQLLRLLVGSGRRARAVQAFEAFRQRLGEEIGARPLPATRAALDG